MMVIRSYLSYISCICLIRVYFWRFNLISFVWNRFAHFFSSSLTLCVGVCTLDKGATSPSLHRLTSYIRRPPPVSLARDSGSLSDLPVSLTCSFVVCSPQVSRVCWIPSVWCNKWDWSHSAGGLQKSWIVIYSIQLFLPLGRSWELGFWLFSPGGRAMYGFVWQLPALISFSVLISPQAARFFGILSVLWKRQDKSVRPTPVQIGALDMWTNSFFSQEEAELLPLFTLCWAVVTTSPSYCLCCPLGGWIMLVLSDVSKYYSKTGETEARRLGNFCGESEALDMQTTSSHYQELAGSYSFILIVWHFVSARSLVREYPKSPYQLWWVWFCVHLIFRSILISFCIFHKGGLFLWIVETVCLWRRVQGRLLFCHFADQHSFVGTCF